MRQANQAPKSKISYIPKETPPLKVDIIMPEENHTNNFYSDCMKYFDSLRKQGKQDFAFEDEFFYTMPAISEKMLIEK